MTDLWPDFLQEQVNTNDSIQIINAQVENLGKKTQQMVQATFSKVSYPQNALVEVGNIMEQINNPREKLEGELQGKVDAHSFLKKENYKFEIYSATYRFRVFILSYSDIYPIKLMPDEAIADELALGKDISIESDEQLKEILAKIFRSVKLKAIIQRIMEEGGSTSEFSK
jgi:hypothetical protein